MKRQQLEDLMPLLVAKKDLAERLAHGHLALFLGAGISDAYGLPSWQTLVENCCKSASIDCSDLPANATSDDLKSKIDAVRRKASAKFVKFVTEALYSAGTSGRSDYDGSLLMRALGVSMMGGTRGGISEVITVNFDSLLESHMRLHGYLTQTITRLPALENRSDVRIYHPNGYLPQPGLGDPSSVEELVFDSVSFDKRLADPNGPWNQLMSNVLSRKIGLVIGLSTKEDFVRITVAGMEGKLTNHDRPVCYWLLSRTDSSGKDCLNLQTEQDQLLDRGCVPVVLDSFDAYPKFIFEICQMAAARSLCS